ncbi:MAG: GGDEF domain-containing protein [Planctomycetes bacterium]|nr:GGDEF domain-containing protein [Planctomycetota bacterium]
MSSSILDKIRLAENLPSLPTVAVQVLQLTHGDGASVAEIARVIEHDPALTSKILKVANSSLFGMPRQISSLQQAVVILGLRTVKVMALTFSLVEASQGKEPGGFDYQMYWRHSLTCTVAARLLAQHLPGCQADELFVAALLCDIGTLAAFHANKDAYREVLAESQTAAVPVHVVEHQHFGATHETFSSLLLDTWGLPERMVKAIAVHHREPDELLKITQASGNTLVPILGAAVLIADLFCSAGGASQLPIVRAHVPKLVPITDQQLQDLLSVLQQEVEEMAATWSIDIGAARSYKEIQAEAVVQLAKLTMAAELERAQLAVREKELHHENQNLAQKATTDGLTGIANRIAFEEHLARSCGERNGPESPVGLLLLDIDRFKRLNDTFGHQTGDSALRLVGQHLKGLNGERRLAARYGGEEFAVVVTDASADELRRLAESIRLGIQQLRIPFQQRQLSVTVSIGVALLGAHAADATPADLIARADKCLYEAKETGRNRAIFHEPPTAGPPGRSGAAGKPQPALVHTH